MATIPPYAQKLNPADRQRFMSMSAVDQNDWIRHDSQGMHDDLGSINPMWSAYARIANGRGVQFDQHGGNVQGVGRPSTTALKQMGSTTGRQSTTDSGMTYEQQRQARILENADARAEAGIAEDRASNMMAFDLNTGRAAAREQAVGDIRRTQGMQDARAGADIYFDPSVTRQRNDEAYNRMEEIRKRYSDPAIVKAQADIAAAQVRGQYGIARQEATNQGNAAVQGLRNEGSRYQADTRARGGAASAIAGQGGNPDEYLPPPPQGGADPAKTISLDELQEFARQHGMSLETAIGQARTNGYTLQNQ